MAFPGALIGFVDIGSINNHLSNFEHQLEKDSSKPPLG